MFKKSPKKYKDNLIVKRITDQANVIILDACMKFEYYLIRTVGENVFCIYYILYHI